MLQKIKRNQPLQILKSHILVKKDFESNTESIKDLNNEGKNKTALEELENLIGMDDVKIIMYQIHDYLKVQMMRRDQGLVGKPLSLHMQLVGNPGTGKTTKVLNEAMGGFVYRRGI